MAGLGVYSGFPAELRRRHIFRIGGVYAVAAWGIAQLVDLLSQTFALPDWIAQPALVVLTIGFPVVLIAAWMIVGAANEADRRTERLNATATAWALATALVMVLAILTYQQIVPATLNVGALGAAGSSSAPVFDASEEKTPDVLLYSNRLGRLSGDTA